MYNKRVIWFVSKNSFKALTSEFQCFVCLSFRSFITKLIILSLAVGVGGVVVMVGVSIEVIAVVVGVTR